MSLTPEQAQQLKNQLKEQIKHLPDSQKQKAESEIEQLSDDAIEEMLQHQKTLQKSIYRAIINGEIPSKKIDENEEAIAVLDIKPISKGHAIVIPKKEVMDVKDLSTQASALAKKLAKRIETKLNAKEVEIQTEFKFGEIIINLIPIYDKPLSLSSQRQEIPEPKLAELQNILKSKQEEKPIELKEEPKKTNQLIQLKRRIP